MKLTTGILAIAMMTAGSWAAAGAQNSDAIDNARSTAKSLQQKQANDSTAAKPAPGAPAPAVKPAVIPSSKPVAATPVTKPVPAPKVVSVTRTSQSSAQHNQLQKVSVVPGADGLQIEINSTHAVTPRLTKLTSPDRVLVELPETVLASAQNKISVGSAGVKGVRIGMDGKTPPTTSVVVDLEKPLAYELTPSSGGKLILTLHSDGAAPSVAKSSPASPLKVSTAAPATKAAVAAVQPSASSKAAAAAPKVAVAKASAPKSVTPFTKPDVKQQAKAVPVTKIAAPVAVLAKPAAAKQPKPEEKKWAMNGKRDPFFSPVVQQNGSGCSTGKKCLEIGAINVRGVVKSDTGFIAVVTNNLNKAYFLRENDPVFNGYVVKITGDSVVFQETIQDKLGKSFTREVVKRIFTPAV
jgi:hypothetical protein